MVFPEIGNSFARVGEAFEGMTLTEITVVGSAATFGAFVAASFGALAANLLGRDLTRFDRIDAAVFGAAALLYVVGVPQILGSQAGGPLAVGGAVMVGLAAFAVVLGPVERSPEGTGRIRKAVEAMAVDPGGASVRNALGFGHRARLPENSGMPECATCGEPAGTVTDVGHGRSAPDGGFRGT